MEDKRLDRLFDYTKFHIGIYLATAGGIVTIIATAAEAEKGKFIGNLIGCPIALVIALALMVLAGIAGGIIAASATEYERYDDLWTKPQGPFGIPIATGKCWAGIEHGAFWLSLTFLAYGILSAPAVRSWLRM